MPARWLVILSEGSNENRQNDCYSNSWYQIGFKEKAMAQYIIVYVGGNHPTTPEEGKRHFTKYMEWIASLGDSVVSPANPFKNTCTINPDGEITPGGITSISGYTIIEADSIETAQKAAQSCPFLDIGGFLEVSELIQMSGKR